MRNSICILLMSVFTAMSTMAQHKTFTLEDLNSGGERYHEMTPERRYFAWWGDELLQLEVDGVYRVDKAKGGRRQLFSLDEMLDMDGVGEEFVGVNLLKASFPYKKQPLALLESPKGHILYDFQKHRIAWQQNREGSLEWNAQGRVDAFSRDCNLWVRLADGAERQITEDGSRDIVYGRSVHRNEFGINKGTFFSPDGGRLAFYRMDQSMVADYPQVNTFERMAVCEPDKYPMAGMTSHEVTVGVYDIKADSTVWLDFGNPKDRYFTNVTWSPDGRRIYLYEVNRAQNRATLDEYDALSGHKLRCIDTEEDAKYVEPQHPVTFVPWDEGRFLAWSQKNGYWHLYLYNAVTGRCLDQLTDGEWVVLDLVGFCKRTNSVIILANRKTHLQHNLYAVNLDTKVVTPLDNGCGVHEAVLSESGEYAVDKWSEPDRPRAYALTDIAGTVKSGGYKSRELFESGNPWQDYAVPHYTTGTIKAADDTTTLHWRMVLPPDFSPEKKYPTVVYVYGGPHAHLVEASWHWGSRSWETYMAQNGFIVFALDNRGSENRGKAFEQVTFRKLGQEEMRDQMCGVEYLRSLPYVDAERLGLHGWSYGGFMTISLMTNYPDVFKVAVAGGPVIDWKWYEVMYGERYMDTPEENEAGYAMTSLMSKASALKGRLQIIIGMNDPVVVPQHALQFLNACNEAGTQPDFYVYPGEEHNMMGHLSVHLHERITRYFNDWLK
ncbi:MAG: DPP IV N-terminal domain-containing protein [Prevotellaceae bacterium]|nr:DPP IV N-terminal domain-containing protein [Prevotellaceae bacterium]